MNIQYQNKPVFLDGLSWLPGTLVPVSNGFVIQKPDGHVVSVQPNGNYEDRPAGTQGNYETCTLDPDLNVLHFKPAGVPFAVAYKGV